MAGRRAAGRPGEGRPDGARRHAVPATAALVPDDHADDEQRREDEAYGDEPAAQPGLPVARDPAVRGLDVAVSDVSAIGVPAQKAANNKH